MLTEYKFTYTPNSNDISEDDFLKYINSRIAEVSKPISTPLTSQNIKRITLMLMINPGCLEEIEALFTEDNFNHSPSGGVYASNKICHIYFYEDESVLCKIVFHNVEKLIGPITMADILRKIFWRIIFTKAQNEWVKFTQPACKKSSLTGCIKNFQQKISIKDTDAIYITAEY